MRALILLGVFIAVIFGGYIYMHEEQIPTPQENAPATTTLQAIDTLPHSDTLTATTSTFSTPAASTTPLLPTTSIVAPTPARKRVMTTYFWVGEKAGPDNDYITNVESYFDERWAQHFGGEDDPDDRCGYKPCAFTPKENPFYFALPYGDLDEDGNRKANASKIPWFNSVAKKEGISILKNRWIEIKHDTKVCYAQWEDVGPFGEEDFDYVFGGNNRPRNSENEYAGLDVSPATWDCLGMATNGFTEWRFVEEKDVPSGPWKELVTYSR